MHKLLVSTTLAFLIASLGGAAAYANTTPEHFKPLEFLVGHCWTGTFPDGKAKDTVCYDWMLEGRFIRSRHTVKSNAPDYKGETIYYRDGASKKLSYRYWNTDGGYSDGILDADGKVLRINEEVYHGPDGKKLRFQGEIERLSDTTYQARTRSWDGKNWKAAWAITFTRSDAAPSDASGERKAAFEKAVGQLRETHGKWKVTTEFLKPDGSIAKAATGTYEFDWVVKDRILKGESDIPELGNKAAILFYVKESKGLIEMASVGNDAQLWVMTGPADDEARTTPDTPMSDGSTLKLRFTRFNIQPDRFESKMELSTDGGATWAPGNHQVFVRRQ
jgi:hypothetical protein